MNTNETNQISNFCLRLKRVFELFDLHGDSNCDIFSITLDISETNESYGIC